MCTGVLVESHQAAEAQYLIFSTADFQRQRYDVVAAVMHRGEHTHSGHYAVYRKQGAHWLLMGDGKATRVLPEDVKDDSEYSTGHSAMPLLKGIGQSFSEDGGRGARLEAEARGGAAPDEGEGGRGEGGRGEGGRKLIPTGLSRTRVRGRI
ncbi:hypothetical protein LTR87_014018 [Friedmanniomyces endolithicus]|nr:hypothetical protein LTR87_014018 [Friedmanniomyces endolithicus]